MRELPAWPPNDRLEHDHRQPLGGGVYRRGEAGRARADDRDVVRAVGMIDADHAEGARQIDLGGFLSTDPSGQTTTGRSASFAA